MRFAVLGSLTAFYDDGGAITVAGAKARSLLAVLLLEPNRTVPSETVMDVLWGEEPPPTATASLHNHVARLRRGLQDTDGTRLRTRSRGLELRVGVGELDRDEFEQRIRRAEEARNQADWATAEREAGAALELWRGTPFTDIPALADHPVVTFLQEQRLQALECRYEALLHLDRLDGLAPELGILVKEHPYREALHRQLMLVLGRTDRRAEALAVFRALRRTLVEELGVEPGLAIQEAHREVLHGTAGPRGPQEAKPLRLDQLPSAPREFVGRAEQIAEIRAALESDRHRTALAVISGMPGVGKTGLALHLAEQLRDAFPDGRLYLHLHGATPGVAPLEPTDALAVLLRGLGVDARRIPYDVAASSALLRSALARTRTLLVLDDAASVSQVRPLLPAGAGCAVLLTSRRPLATLESSARVRLEPLSPRDSALLLERASGRSWGASDAEPVARLGALCGHLPLALRVSAARLRSRRSLPVGKLVERLDRQEDRLDHLELEDLSVRRSLLAAHEALQGSGDPLDSEAATALVLIGALDLPEYGAPLVAAAMDSTERRAERVLERLAEVALLQEMAMLPKVGGERGAGPGDVTVGWNHAAGPDVAVERNRATGPGPTVSRHRAAAPGLTVGSHRSVGPDNRVGLDHPVDTDRTMVAGRTVGPDHTTDPDLTVGWDHTTDPDRTVGWERPVGHGHTADYGRYAPHDLVRDFARELAARTDEQARFAEAAERCLRWYLDRLAHCAAALRPDPGRSAGQASTGFADAAEALAWGDTEAANLLHLAGSGAHGRLGTARTLDLINALFPYLHDRGRVRDLERLTRHAIALARSSGNTAAEGRAVGHLASAHYSAGRLRQALLVLDEAVDLSEHLADDLPRMRHLGNRAALLRELGEAHEARATLSRCLALRPRHLTPADRAKLLGHQGYVAELTDLRSALSYHRRSRELAREAGSSVIEQVALCNMGRAHLALDEPALALRSFDTALRVMAGGAAHWNAERETRLGRAQALRLLGHLRDAEQACTALIDEAAARGDSYGRGLTEYELGHVLRALGDERAARRRWDSALSALAGTDAPVLADLRVLSRSA